MRVFPDKMGKSSAFPLLTHKSGQSLLSTFPMTEGWAVAPGISPGGRWFCPPQSPSKRQKHDSQKRLWRWFGPMPHFIKSKHRKMKWLPSSNSQLLCGKSSTKDHISLYLWWQVKSFCTSFEGTNFVCITLSWVLTLWLMLQLTIVLRRRFLKSDKKFQNFQTERCTPLQWVVSHFFANFLDILKGS